MIGPPSDGAAILQSPEFQKSSLIKGAWLAAETHLDLVGGYTPETREADDEAARRSRIFVDLG